MFLIFSFLVHLSVVHATEGDVSPGVPIPSLVAPVHVRDLGQSARQDITTPFAIQKDWHAAMLPTIFHGSFFGRVALTIDPVFLEALSVIPDLTSLVNIRLFTMSWTKDLNLEFLSKVLLKASNLEALDLTFYLLKNNEISELLPAIAQCKRLKRLAIRGSLGVEGAEKFAATITGLSLESLQVNDAGLDQAGAMLIIRTLTTACDRINLNNNNIAGDDNLVNLVSQMCPHIQILSFFKNPFQPSFLQTIKYLRAREDLRALKRLNTGSCFALTVQEAQLEQDDFQRKGIRCYMYPVRFTQKTLDQPIDPTFSVTKTQDPLQTV